MSNINTTETISYRTQGYCRSRFLEEGQMEGMIFERFGQVSAQKKNTSKTAKWRRYNNLPVNKAKAALAEGVTPAGTKITFEDVNGVLEPIGDWVPLTDVILDTHEDNENGALIDHYMKLCGRQAAEVKEERRADVLKSGSNVFYAGSGVTARSGVNAAVTRQDFRNVNRFFRRKRAKKITSIITATAKYGTMAVEPAFVAICHPDLEDTLRDVTGFNHWANYSSSDKRLPGEIGSIESVRIVIHDVVRPWLQAGSSGTTTYLSDGVTSTGSNAYDVYPIICIAQDAYGIVPLQGAENVEIMIRNPKPEKGNELAQEGSVGWKGWDLTVRLNESYIARIECCAKSLS